MRKLRTLLVAAGLLTVLAGCAGAADPPLTITVTVVPAQPLPTRVYPAPGETLPPAAYPDPPGIGGATYPSPGTTTTP